MNETAASSLRVLVVDDNVDAAETLGMVLKTLGVPHRIAFYGDQALDMAAEFDPHLLFLDLGMPGMDGFELARRLRDAPGGATRTLVALTGWSQEKDVARARAAGFDHHLPKPADFAVLEALLARIHASVA